MGEPEAAIGGLAVKDRALGGTLEMDLAEIETLLFSAFYLFTLKRLTVVEAALVCDSE